jgi:hypothetical protein
MTYSLLQQSQYQLWYQKKHLLATVIAKHDNTYLNPIFDSNEDIDNSAGVGICGGTHL